MTDLNSNLITTPHPANEDDLRKAATANMLSMVGISAGDNLQKMEDVLGPVNGRWDLSRPFKCYQDSSGRWVTEGVSTCGLVARSLWRRMKVDMDALYSNYVFGTAISAERMFAIKYNNFVNGSTCGDLIPSPGDYLIIGNGLSTHALTCIGWDSLNMFSVDGGQIDLSHNNLQCIKKCERLWSVKSDGAYLGTRKVVGWINLFLLPFKDEDIIVPEDWENN
jgi:hypothetical protein